MQQLFTRVEDGYLSEWPLSPDQVRHVVRVRFFRGEESLLDKWRDLYVRSAVVKTLAGMYIDRKISYVENRPGV